VSRTALLLSTHPPGGHSGPGTRGLVTLEALRECCARVDAVALAYPDEESAVAPGVHLLRRPPLPGRWGWLAAVARGGSSFVPERGGQLARELRTLAQDGTLLPAYDLVWTHFPLMAGLGARVPARARVLDVDTVWGAARGRAAAHAAGGPLQRAYRRLDAAAVAREERRRCDAQDHLVVASERERELLPAVRPPVIAIPNTVPAPAQPLAPAARRDGMLFVGILDHEANVDAATFLAREVLPRVRAQLPDAALTIAGRGPTPFVRRLCQEARVRLVPDAPTLDPLYAEARVVVAPLFMGGGTHVKIVEAMARGAAIVASPIAAEGLDLRDGEHLHLAQTAEDFAARCVALLRDPEQADRLGAAARERWRERHRPEVARRAVAGLVERLV
jgi:glycosyltransferase involved in cell wall biosynthesis